MTTMKAIKKMISEQDMVNAFVKWRSGRTKYIYVEVPVFSRCVDVVVLNSKKQITAIEFKKEKWKEAIEQLQRVTTSFDYLEICILLPRQERVKKGIIENCEQLGIGLYFMDPATMKTKKVLKPKKNELAWRLQKRQVKNYLEGREKDERNAAPSSL